MPSTKDAPQAIDAERAILGAILLNNAAWEQAAQMDPSEFFLDSHRVLFGAIKNLMAQHVPVDLVTLAQALLDQGALERIGGASYVSSLTDNLPKLQNIGHYIGLVHEKARLRRAIAAGQDIAARAQDGDTAAIAEAAKQLVSDNGNVPGPRPEKPIPEAPEAAWCGLARRYRESVGRSTEASDNFHLAAFITVAGAILGRLVYYNNPEPLYPNFFTALVGKSGRARKGTAIDFSERLARKVNPDLHWLRSLNSAAGFVQALWTCQERQEQRRTVSAVLRFSELRSLIDKARQEGARDIIPELSNAFDSPPVLERNTVKSSAVQRPVVSILGGASPMWIDNLKIEDLQGGIGNRFCWVAGAAKKRNHRPPAPDLTRSIMDLGSIRHHWLQKGKAEEGIEITMSAEADSIYETWYRGLDRHYEHELFQVLADRMEVHCPKVAMLYAALDRRPQIEAEDIRAAMAYCEFLMESLACVFSDYGWELAAKQDQQIIEYVRRFAGGVPARRVQKQFSKWGGETFNKRLMWLCGEDGPLRREKLGRANWLMANQED